jgi:hypothetical protein
MTWDPQGSGAPQDPYAPGAQPPPPGQAPPPQGQFPPPPGQVPPPGYPPQGQVPPPGYAPPPADPWGQAPPPPPPPGPNSSWGGPPQPMWQPPPAFPLAPDAYPVNISYDRGAHINRLWGIPLIGQLVRAVLAIPHYIVLMLVGIVAAIQLLVTWIPILILGRYPGWGYRWTGGLLAYAMRVYAYVYLMTGTYPPFSLSGEMYPISIRYDEGVRINRLWGIPVIGYLVRFIVLIPHFLVLWVLSIVVWFLLLVVWVPVLILGRQADVIYTIVGGYFRWYLRVTAYMLMMVDRYPPFSLGEDDPRL